MIQGTFCHIPGIGLIKERKLWQNGIRGWEELASALRSGATPAELLRHGHGTQQKLFDTSGNVASRQATDWLKALEQSFEALANAEYDFFLSKLPPAEHWRVLADCLDDALCLDIETTGLSKELHHVTVIGALRRRRFYQWVWPEELDGLWQLISESKLLVTFNGRLFDVPFLQAHFADCPEPRGHVDLRYLASKAGIPGGQKGVEKHYGYSREEEVKDVRGAEAVALWSKALYGDREAYGTLLSYNRADVEMLPSIAARLCEDLAVEQEQGRHTISEEPRKNVRCFHRPASFKSVKEAWNARRGGLHLLEPVLHRRMGRLPLVVGVDLRGNPKRPTGFAVCQGERVETRIVYDDEEIIESILAVRPDLVSIDAPLSLPRGRRSVRDDSPCRESGGIVRDAERVLWSRRIPVYPSLIRHMQGLTQRGIEITDCLRKQGVPVIESYPGAAQDVLGIARKGVDVSLLALGLGQFGFDVNLQMSHDELDAVTSALVGYLFLANEYEAIGADDEGYMILPLGTAALRWQQTSHAKDRRPRAICLAGVPGAGKTTLAMKLSIRLRSQAVLLGRELRAKAQESTSLAEELDAGNMAPEATVEEIVMHAAHEAVGQVLVVDGFPRHPDQLALADRTFSEWCLVILDIDQDLAASRIGTRLTCGWCGWVSRADLRTDQICPVCNARQLTGRREDTGPTLEKRIRAAQDRLLALRQSVTPERQLAVEITDTPEEIVERILPMLENRSLAGNAS